MPMHIGDPLWTMHRVYQEICLGEDAWVALGNFLNDWDIYETLRRDALIADPPEVISSENWQWAVFIAASVEYLCLRDGVTVPLWVHDECYMLETAWYDVPYLDEVVQQWLEETTPEPFCRRKIYCGDRVYLKKEAVVARTA